MNNIIKIFKQATVVVSIEIAVAIMVITLIILFGIIPGFNSWQEARTKNSESTAKLDKVEQNIAAIKSLDEAKIQMLVDAYEKLLPSAEDSLRFFTLAENVTEVSGMNLSAAQLDAAPATIVTPTPTPGGAPTLGGGASAGAGVPGAPVSTSLVGVQLSFTGKFTNLFKLLANFGKADRVALIKDLSINEEEEGGDISAGLKYSLPLAQASSGASAEVPVSLTVDDITFLEKYLQGILYSASPATGATGRPDPFN